MRRWIYRALVRPVFFRWQAEDAHEQAMRVLASLAGSPPALAVLRMVFGSPQFPREVFGLTFPNPLGLAAGFDKDAVALPAWEALGFGFVEIGTVTAQAQPGNPRPRLFRLPEQRGLINRLGFNNGGADAVAERLAFWKTSGLWPRGPVGINLGKSRVVPVDEAAEDYLASFRKLRGFADYVVVNVSSPNTPGLRSLQAGEALAPLLEVLGEANGDGAFPRRPLLVKLAPDLDDDQLDDLVEVCERQGVDGLVATNTTLDHSAVPPEQNTDGGLSGAPLMRRSTDVLRTLSARTRLPLIGVGGIQNAGDARTKLAGGASLLQAYTGFIYEGPTFASGIVRALARGPG